MRHSPIRTRGLTIALLWILTNVAAEAQQDETRAVSALGRIEPRGGVIKVGAPSTPEAISGAVLAQLLVKEGERVSAGQLLAVTDAMQVVEAIVDKANAELSLAEIAAQAADSKADEACVLAQVAASEAERRADLLERGLASQEETELAQGTAQASRASCTAAKANVQVANAAIEVARADLAYRMAEYERTRIFAPADGMVLDLTVKPGELIGPEGILEMGQVDQMVAIAEVYETDISRVRVGQRAEVRSDALPSALGGRVESIALKVHKQDETGTDPAAAKDARIVEVEILLDDASTVERLTNLQVEIIIQP